MVRRILGSRDISVNPHSIGVKGRNTPISCLVIVMLVIIFAGVNISARGEGDVPRLWKSIRRGAAPEARRVDNRQTSASLKSVKEIMSGSEMVGYCKSSHVGLPKEKQQRGRVLRVGANSLVGNDVLLPKRFRDG